ncbi:sodium/proton antiporter, CPA1 family (TC 2.A.36) [Roseomonas rosea]|uniref:Sodium/proton antiporter, CPA1 family (TC 2.A.36) n=1 Tax=Muricoccus roseus TaxID=198092 RepID=A0A1M6M6P3_9PROT|nr:Na+/H+ antiporter [Roseomonas rosea]SHJ79118.1 sodium/proton antiporter, CPA1 family (TC 2.A.36) [Roseomonas rosea]
MLLLEITLALLAVCLGFAIVSRHTRLPYAVVLILGGMVLAFVPGLPRVELDPTVALAAFLPPLLQASAWRTDWQEFRANLRPILMLAVGAVFFTAACVAVAAKLLLPDLPWAAAIALGAVVAPPDAVAAASVLQRLPLPRRIVTVLEGESLVNDASSLVLFRLAVGALAAGSVAPGIAGLTFLGVALGGLAVGFAIAWLAARVLPRLGETPLEIAFTFLVGYGAFLLAERLHVSGVIAVVTAGILLAQRQRSLLTPRTRIESLATWGFVEFALTSLVFILVGLQLNGILERLGSYHLGFLALSAATLSVTLIVSRIVWVMAFAYLPRLIPALARDERQPAPRHAAIIGWAGMRGVVSLATALALPLEVPHRELLIFLAFVAILATLVVQGTTLEWLIIRLGVVEPRHKGMSAHEAAARRLMAEAARAEVEGRLDSPLDGAIARDLAGEFRDIARVFTGVAAGGPQAELRARLQIRLAALRASRERLLQHHREDGLSDEVLTSLLAETDHEELRLVQQLAQAG